MMKDICLHVIFYDLPATSLHFRLYADLHITLKIRKCHTFYTLELCLSSNYKMALKGNRVFSVGFPRNRL